MADKKIIIAGRHHAEQHFYKGVEWLEISLYPLFMGSKDADPQSMIELFTYLRDEGYCIHGISRDVGPYDSTDDLLLSASRPQKK